MKLEKIRELFEEISATNFGYELIPKNATGEYINPNMEDHWQTFQEGFEAAITECLKVISEEQDLAENNWQCKNGVHIWHKIRDFNGVVK